MADVTEHQRVRRHEGLTSSRASVATTLVGQPPKPDRLHLDENGSA